MTRAEATTQIEKLLIVYNNGWKPDWNDNHLKLCIARNRNSIFLTSTHYDYHLLAFNSWGARSEFIKNHFELVNCYLGCTS